MKKTKDATEPARAKQENSIIINKEQKNTEEKQLELSPLSKKLNHNEGKQLVSLWVTFSLIAAGQIKMITSTSKVNDSKENSKFCWKGSTGTYTTAASLL